MKGISLIFRYDSGKLPNLVPDTDGKPNEKMLQLHDMSDRFLALSKGLVAQRLKLDALERYVTRDEVGGIVRGLWPACVGGVRHTFCLSPSFF